MLAVSIFLGFRVGRNSRALAPDCSTTRYVDRAMEPGAMAGDAATGVRLTIGAEGDPPPELLLEK